MAEIDLGRVVGAGVSSGEGAPTGDALEGDQYVDLLTGDVYEWEEDADAEGQ